MSTSDSPKPRPKVRSACPERSRSDGWTPRRQLLFLNTLIQTRSVTKAAASAGMSRESAYRLRKRDNGGLFTLLWRAAFAPTTHAPTRRELYESHIATIRRGLGPEGANFRPPAQHRQFRDPASAR